MRQLPRRDLGRLARALHKVEGVEAAVLYGSVARGDYGARSDIDVLVVASDARAAGAAQEALAELDLSRSVQPTVRTKQQLEKTDFGLLRRIFQEGLVLFARKPLELPAAGLLAIKPHVLFTFSLGNIPQKEKARVNRLLYHSKQQGKSGGIVGDVGGRRLARGCVLVPASARKRLEMVFKHLRIQAEALEIWL